MIVENIKWGDDKLQVGGW